MSNFIKSQAKRKRELAKLDKRQAKDQKRAQKKAELRGTDDAVPSLAVAPVGQSAPVSRTISPPAVVASRVAVVSPAAAPKPMTLAEAAERWKSMKVAKPAKR
jgi:hypothetical protein